MEEAINIKIIVLNFIAFFILLFVIRYVVWPKLSAFIESRRKEIEDLLKKYAAQNEEVNLLVDKMKKEAEMASERRTKFLEEAKRESKKLREEIIEKAYYESKSMIERAKIEIQIERRQMVEELRNNISNLVVNTVEKILTNVVDENLDKKILIETEKAVNFKHEI